MEQIKKFITCSIPITACNLRCHYCYITQMNLWKNKKTGFSYSAEHIGKSLTKKRLGGICMFNLCGDGETLLPQETVDIVYALLQEGHFVTIITNATLTKRIEQLIAFPEDFRERLLLKCSFQYFELKRLNLLGRFFGNIRKARAANISITLELVANDEMIPDIPEIKRLSVENLGAPCHVVIPRVNNDPALPVLTTLPEDEFLKTWSVFDSPLFDFKREIWGINRRKFFCYAGAWGGLLDMGTGDFYQCYHAPCLQNLFKDTNSPLCEIPIGHECKMAHCYNGHAFLSFGCIPDMGKTPGYDEMRNRICTDGTQWLSERMKKFCATKLYDSNKRWEKLHQRFFPPKIKND